MNPMAQRCPSLALCGYYELQLLFHWNITHFYSTFLNQKPWIKKHILQNTGINSTLKLPEINGKRDFTFDLY